jgi:hypothetical protein
LLLWKSRRKFPKGLEKVAISNDAVFSVFYYNREKSQTGWNQYWPLTAVANHQRDNQSKFQATAAAVHPSADKMVSPFYIRPRRL